MNQFLPSSCVSGFCMLRICPLSGHGRDITLRSIGVIIRQLIIRSESSSFSPLWLKSRISNSRFYSDWFCNLVLSGHPWLINSLGIGEAFRVYFFNTVEPIIIKSLSKLRQNKKKEFWYSQFIELVGSEISLFLVDGDCEILIVTNRKY